MATVDEATRIQELRRALLQADSGAYLAEARVLRRIIREQHGFARLSTSIPHTESLVVAATDVRALTHPDELGLAGFSGLPGDCILIAQPEEDELKHWPMQELLQLTWRRLFHASIDRRLQEACRGELTRAQIQESIARIGQVEFDEAHAVLRSELRLLKPASRVEAFCEFCATWSEQRQFSPDLLPVWFPSLEGASRVDVILSEHVAVDTLFTSTRLYGAAPPDLTPRVARDEARLQSSRHDWSLRLGVRASDRAFVRHMRRRDRANERGNTVAAAICGMRAAEQSTTQEKRDVALARVQDDITRLVERIRGAIRFPEDDIEDWRVSLQELLTNAVHGFWNADKRLLYDLQKVCLDHERTTYRVDLVKWIVSRGRRPLRRPLTSVREVMMAKHLASAAGRLVSVRLSGAERHRLEGLLQEAAHLAEQQMRQRMRPAIRQTLLEVGVIPQSVPEQVAFDKLIEEALDCIADRGYITMGYLRDAISRNDLKLDDLTDPRDLIRGDHLLRSDDRLDVSLDGVYRRGEFYLRWLQVVSSMFFGTRAGRFVTLFLAIPFGGAVIIVEGVRHLWHVLSGTGHPTESWGDAADESPAAAHDDGSGDDPPPDGGDRTNVDDADTTRANDVPGGPADSEDNAPGSDAPGSDAAGSDAPGGDGPNGDAGDRDAAAPAALDNGGPPNDAAGGSGSQDGANGGRPTDADAVPERSPSDSDRALAWQNLSGWDNAAGRQGTLSLTAPRREAAAAAPGPRSDSGTRDLRLRATGSGTPDSERDVAEFPPAWSGTERPDASTWYTGAAWRPRADESSAEDTATDEGARATAADTAVDSEQTATAPVAATVEPDPLAQVMSERLSSASLVLVIGFLLMGLIHWPRFRTTVLEVLRLIWRLLHSVLIELPRQVIRYPLVRRIWRSRICVRIRRTLATPAIASWLGCRVVPGLLFGRTLGWWWVAAIGVLLSIALNSRLARDTEELTAEWIGNLWHQLHARVFTALLNWIIDFFKQVLSLLERFLYAVDEWLRFHSGESWAMLTLKAVLGVFWSFLAFLIRIYVTLLIEPTLHPVKHFPVVTVAHKITFPILIWLENYLRDLLTPHLGFPLTAFVVWFNIFFLPGFFGFAVWELKENWRLYKSNRQPRLHSVAVGSHGESLARLLRPGFHSGTLPKLFRSLRRLERRGASFRRFIQRRSVRNRLHHVEVDVRRFVERDLISLLRLSAAWRGLPLRCREVECSSNGIHARIECPTLSDEPLDLLFQEQSQWIVASIARPGWLWHASDEQRQVLHAALHGFYRKSAVDLVREQLCRGLVRHYPYDIDDHGLTVWPDGNFETEIVVDLHRRHLIRPSPPAVAWSWDLRPVDRAQVVFADSVLTWDEWQDVWTFGGDHRSAVSSLSRPHHSPVPLLPEP